MKRETQKQIFSLKPEVRDTVRARLFDRVHGAVENVLALDKLEDVYAAARKAGESGGRFTAHVLNVLDVSYRIPPDDLARIPAEGAVVVVANHPFGGIEGIVLLDVLRSVRPDVKVMANYLLGRIPEMRADLICVDPFGRRESVERNVRAMKEVLTWVRNGGLLATFPSGEVSHLNLQQRRVCDPRWSANIGRLIRSTGASVVPLFFEGRNGPLFQLMGLVHPRCRTAMLPHELLNKRNRCLRLRAGSVIHAERLKRFADDATLMDYLRFRTYLLGTRGSAVKRRRRFVRMRRPRVQAVAPPVPAGDIAAEIETLPAQQRLYENDVYSVYLAQAPQIPGALREVGRLREITFRAEGEGTGRPLDLDAFDAHYLHLILWSRKDRQIAGAYRMAKSDEVLSTRGLKGFYTRTLFRYGMRLLNQIGPALELGRSFICETHQRNYYSLMSLWKGIGEVIVRNPRYRGLFGPVSINNEYHSMSRQLIAAFLSMNYGDPKLSKAIRSRKPMRPKPVLKGDRLTLSEVVLDLDEVSALISEIEGEKKSIPILLKQYLKLNGKLLGFNIDPDFSDVLDGLVWVDLTMTDPKILVRFLGRENARAFLAHHGKQLSE